MSDTPLSKYIRMLRTDKDLNQQELAKILGVTRATYSHYETARIIPPTDTLYKLSNYYKVSLSRLIRLAVLSLGEENRENRSAEYVISDNDISLEFDSLYKSFLDECADMSPKELGKWASIEDREIIFYYHRLSDHDKRLFYYFLKLGALNSFDKESKKDNPV